MSTRLDAVQFDRAVGAIVVAAAGDALGAPYEFGDELPDEAPVAFGPGAGGEAPGQWTDDTAMAVPILQAIAAGRRPSADRLGKQGTQQILDGWFRWREEDGRGIGLQVNAVLREARGMRTEATLRKLAALRHEREGRSAGNGSLMRTGPLALGYLARGRGRALAAAAIRVSELTHWERDAGVACALWSLAIRRAILTGEVDVRKGLGFMLDARRRERWSRIVEAATEPGAHPRDFRERAEGRNGWVVLAFQGALAAVSGASSPQDAVERAVRGGGDADTVAAIAGALAGAAWGGSAAPADWWARVHGWPGLRLEDLAALAREAATQGALGA